MKREVDLSEISDGRTYGSGDMVKIGCNDCKGCSKCCRDMGKSIVLDPYDIFMLSRALGRSFEELLSDGVIELSMQDGILLPNIKMNDATNACSLLSEEGRCTVHNDRPGICRLFPLGRVYEEGRFSYFNQIYECDYPNKSKIKIKKWLGIDGLAKYEAFVLNWHDCMNDFRNEISDAVDMNDVSKQMVAFLDIFYRKEYRPDESFIEQVMKRITDRRGE